MIKQYRIVSELLVPTRLKLAELQRDSVGAWQVNTVHGIKLVLGREQIVEKIRRFVIVWRSGFRAKNGQYLTDRFTLSQWNSSFLER